MKTKVAKMFKASETQPVEQDKFVRWSHHTFCPRGCCYVRYDNVLIPLSDTFGRGGFIHMSSAEVHEVFESHIEGYVTGGEGQVAKRFVENRNRSVFVEQFDIAASAVESLTREACKKVQKKPSFRPEAAPF